MVSMGLIAALMSMLVPTVGKARESANRLACMSNLRQIATAIVMYNVANRDAFPAPALAGVAWAPDDWLAWQAGSNPADPVAVRDAQDSALKPFLCARSALTPAVLRCPSDVVASHPLQLGSGGSVTQFAYSYSVNWMVCEPRRYLSAPTYIYPFFDAYGAADARRRPTLRRSQIHSPTEVILLIDENSATIDDGAWAANHTPADGANILSNRHDKRSERGTGKAGGRGNAAFCDGHVDFIPRADAGLQKSWDPFKGGTKSK